MIPVYDAVKADWIVGKDKRQSVKLVFAEYRGKVLGVYSIDGWKQNANGRWEFWGKDVSEEYKKYIGRDLQKKKGQSNPIHYFEI